jgi:hypothetical protein
MVKTLNDLTVLIEVPRDEGTGRTAFVTKCTGEEVPKEEVYFLQQAPILVKEAYGKYHMILRRIVPEEADGLLIGQTALFPRTFAGVMISSANYIRRKR